MSQICHKTLIKQFVQYLRTLAGAYEKTQELAKELHGLGCGDLDVEGKLPTNHLSGEGFFMFHY